MNEQEIKLEEKRQKIQIIMMILTAIFIVCLIVAIIYLIKNKDEILASCGAPENPYLIDQEEKGELNLVIDNVSGRGIPSYNQFSNSS